MTKEELENVVAFCVLMQEGNGILNKAPSYLEEKFNSCMNGGRPLDLKNQYTYNQYFRKWRTNNVS